MNACLVVRPQCLCQLPSRRHACRQCAGAREERDGRAMQLTCLMCCTPPCAGGLGENPAVEPAGRRCSPAPKPRCSRSFKPVSARRNKARECKRVRQGRLLGVSGHLLALSAPPAAAAASWRPACGRAYVHPAPCPLLACTLQQAAAAADWDAERWRRTWSPTVAPTLPCRALAWPRQLPPPLDLWP